MVFSNIFGKTSSAIINTILSQNEYNEEDILKIFIKIARTILVVIYHILSTDEFFNSTD